MNGFRWLEVDAPLAPQLVIVAGHFLWQGAVVLLLSWIATRMLRASTAAARYRVQLALLALLAILPIVTLAVTWPAAPVAATVVANSSATADANAIRLVSEDHLSPAPNIDAADAVRFDWRAFAPLSVDLYGLGVAICLSRLLWAIRGGVWLRRRATPLTDSETLVIATAAAKRIGLRQPPQIARCIDVLVPTVIGILRPAILLPPAALIGLTPAQLEAVLAHEFAHVARLDHLVNLAQRLVESVLFFHPAVWIISRQIRIERERACDERVVAASEAGTIGRQAYARSLVAVAEMALAQRRAAQQAALAASLRATSTRSALRDRIERLLSPADAAPIRLGRAWTIVATMMLVLAASTASLRYGTRVAAQPSSPELPFTVTVLDQETGKPLANARVRLRVDPGKDDPNGQQTDADGKISFSIPTVGRKITFVQATADANDHVALRAVWEFYSKPVVLPEAFTISLPPGVPIGGRVVDAQGEPVAGAKVTLTVAVPNLPPNVRSGTNWESITTNPDGLWTWPAVPKEATAIEFGAYDIVRGGNERGFYNIDRIAVDSADQKALRDGSFEFKLPPVRAISGHITDLDGKPIADANVGLGEDRVASNALPVVKTDATGAYTIGVLPDANVVLTFKSKGHAPELVHIKNTADLGAIDSKLGPAKIMHGRVVDKDGKPVPSARIFVDTWRGARSLNTSFKVDKDGRFEWHDSPTDAVIISVGADGYATSRDMSVSPDQDNLITLARPVVFTGKVIDAETKQPITAFKPTIGIVFDEHGQQPNFGGPDGTSPPEIGKDGSFKLTFDFPYPGRVICVEADGYAPADSQVVTMTGGDQQFTYELHHATGTTLNVVDAAGKPVAHATWILATGGNPLQIENGAVPENMAGDLARGTTDANGHLTYPPQKDPYILVVSSDAGYAEVTDTTVKSDQPLALQAWAHVEGNVVIGRKPAERALVWGASLEGVGEVYDPKKPRLSSTLRTTADSTGHFKIDRVPPGEWSVSRQTPPLDNGMWIQSSTERFTAKPGETTTVQIGGKGRPVVGRVEIPAELKSRTDWSFQMFSIRTKEVQPELPKRMDEIQAMTEEERKAYATSPEAIAYMDKLKDVWKQSKTFMTTVAADGSFRFDDVPPGTYQVGGEINQSRSDRTKPMGEVLGRVVSGDVVIPAGDIETPVEVPALSVTLRHAVKVGDVAPEFDVPTLDGKRIKFSDLKGKFVLLDFWATWCGPCVAEIPNVKAAYEKFKSDDRFALVSLSLDPDQKAPRAFAEKQGMTWTQGFLGDWNASAVPASYGVDGIPSTFLIGPDGKVIAKDLRGEALAPAIEQALQTK